MTVTDLAILGAAIAGSHGWDYDRAERQPWLDDPQ